MTASFEFSHEAIGRLQLPEPIGVAVTCVHLCHFFGRTLRRLDVRQQHPGLYLAGVLANARFGDSRFLKMAAQVVRIAQVLLKTVEESGRLVHSCQRLADSLHTPKRITLFYMTNRLSHEKWPSQEGRAPSVLFLPTPVAVVASSLMVIVMRIVEIVSHIWRLNLCLFDLYDAVCLDPHSQSEVIDDVFLNLRDIAGQFMSRERRLAHAVASHRQWIDELLKLSHVEWSAHNLAATLNSFADQVEGLSAVSAVPVHTVSQMAQGSLALSAALVATRQNHELRTTGENFS